MPDNLKVNQKTNILEFKRKHNKLVDKIEDSSYGIKTNYFTDDNWEYDYDNDILTIKLPNFTILNSFAIVVEYTDGQWNYEFIKYIYESKLRYSYFDIGGDETAYNQVSYTFGNENCHLVLYSFRDLFEIFPQSTEDMNQLFKYVEIKPFYKLIEL